MTSAFSWQNSISLCPASLCILRQNFPVNSKYLLTSYFYMPVPYDEKDIFLVSFHPWALAKQKQSILY